MAAFGKEILRYAESMTQRMMETTTHIRISLKEGGEVVNVPVVNAFLRCFTGLADELQRMANLSGAAIAWLVVGNSVHGSIRTAEDGAVTAEAFGQWLVGENGTAGGRGTVGGFTTTADHWHTLQTARSKRHSYPPKSLRKVAN